MNGIHFIKNKDFVYVELPDGRKIEGPRGATVENFLSLILDELPADLMAAMVNGELRELGYKLLHDAVIRPITMAGKDGMVIYKRSLGFLTAACFEKLFPSMQLEVKHSINGGGTLCTVSGGEFTDTDREALEAEMRTAVKQNLPIIREEIPIEEAREIFRRKGQQDKLDLLSYRKKDYLVTYTMGDFRNYFYGYMLPSSGYLKYFRLEKAGEKNQFLLRFPRHGTSPEIKPLTKYKRLQPIFAEYNNWQKRLDIDTISSINHAIEEKRIENVILVSESLQNREFMRAAEAIVSRPKVRMVMIAGPSSSGKTTSSKRLSIELLAHGISPIPVAMDDFFLPRELYPRDEQGNYDFEDVKALNIGLFMDCMSHLMKGEEVQMPRYNFKKGMPELGNVLQLKENQILIVEGIHGLNPIMTEGLPEEQIYRIFISPMTQVNMDHYNRVSITDVRLIRRIVRDFRDRGYSAEATIARWESVRNGEDKYIIPYQDTADMFINTSLVYELSALKSSAEPALRMVPWGSDEYSDAKRLLTLLEWVKPLDLSLVPANSILAEFIGGSNLADFVSWGA